MAELRELGPVHHISPEAIGQPGQRRFRLRALTRGGDSTSLWLEKEQLSALGDAIETVLNAEEYRYLRPPLDDVEPAPSFPLSADYDFRIAQLSMGLNREKQRVVLMAAETANPDEPGTAISVEFDYRQAHELRDEITRVVASGRPPCPLCGGPLDPQGHVCPRTNGHHAKE
ncbi:MAG: DUF3090 family protein [Chloroflexi bacterium]|nr:DUF3090 family protein [Chloroflexota bacterium]